MKSKAYLVATKYYKDGIDKIKIAIYSEKRPSVDVLSLVQQITLMEAEDETFEKARYKLIEAIELDSMLVRFASLLSV